MADLFAASLNAALVITYTGLNITADKFKKAIDKVYDQYKPEFDLIF